MMKYKLLLLFVFIFQYMKGQNNNFGYKSLINNYCWGIINDTLNRYEIDQNILGTHIYMLFDTENPYRRTANKCNITKTTLSENPFLVVNKKTITLDEIDRVELCQPIGIYYKRENGDTYIAIQLTIRGYTKVYENYYIFLYLYNNTFRKYKILYLSCDELSDKQIKHYMRNRLKY